MSDIPNTRVNGRPARLDAPEGAEERRAAPDDIPITSSRYNTSFAQPIDHPVRVPGGVPATEAAPPPQPVPEAAPQTPVSTPPPPAVAPAPTGTLPPPLLTAPVPPRPVVTPEPFSLDFSEWQPQALSVPLIAISGHDGSGKSTLARVIAAEYGGEVISFADALKIDLMTLGYDDIRDKPTPPHYRALMRAHGEAARVRHGTDYWVRRWAEAAAVSAARGSRVIVCDDMRHLSELLAVWKLGGTALALLRPAAEPDPGDLGVNAAESVREVWAVRSRIESALLRVGVTPGVFPEIAARAGIRMVPTRPDHAELTPRQYLNGMGLGEVLDIVVGQ